MPICHLATLSETLARIAGNGALAQRLRELPGLRGDDAVACLPGDVHLPALDLAAPLAEGSPLHACLPPGQTLPAAALAAIVIDGHLRLDGALTSGAPHGTPHLLVAGDVHAHDAQVNGLIDVGGALALAHLLWGHGAPGALRVRGGLSARVALFSGAFQVQIGGPEHIGWLVDEVRGRPHLAEFSPEMATALFLPHCLAGSGAPLSAGEHGVAPLLDAAAIGTTLRQGRSVLAPDEAIAAAWPLATTLFADEALNIANVRAAVRCAAVGHKQYQASGWFGQTDFALCQRHVDADGDARDDSVYITVWKRWDFYLSVEHVPDQRGPLARLAATLRQRPTPFTPRLLLAYRHYGARAAGPWLPLDASAPPEALAACTQAWRGVLDYLRKAEGQARAGYPLWRRLQAELTPARIVAFTSAPRFAEQYNDWWDSERNGWWEDDVWVGARQPGMHEGLPCGRALKLSWRNGTEAPGDVEDDAHGAYQADLDEAREGPAVLEWTYAQRQSDARSPLPRCAADHLARLLRMYALLETRLREGADPSGTGTRAGGCGPLVCGVPSPPTPHPGAHPGAFMAKGQMHNNKMAKKPKKDTSPPREGHGSDRPTPPMTTVIPRGKDKNK